MMRRAWVDYRAVKAAVSMEMALANYGISLHRLDRAYLRGGCPLPTHQSKSSAHTFIVNIDKNAWACHSDSCAAARGGRIGGNVLDFIAAMENCSIRDAALKLKDWFAVTASHQPSTERRPEPVESGPAAAGQGDLNRPLPFVLGCIDSSHHYLAERGVDQETARYFGIGYNRGKGSMEGRVVIPIHNEEGVLVAYAGRALGAVEPKYRFPPRFRKSVVLFNLHRAGREGKTVVVVEGFFDAVRVHQAGLPCVVALMGCSLSIRQEEQLNERFDSVVLFLDGDAAGRRASESIAARLVRSLSVRLVTLPNGQQPDSLGHDQIRCLCDNDYF